VDLSTSEEVAVKLEHVKTRHPQLQQEYKLYRLFMNKSTPLYYIIISLP
jgi:hypothetical protein